MKKTSHSHNKVFLSLFLLRNQVTITVPKRTAKQPARKEAEASTLTPVQLRRILGQPRPRGRAASGVPGESRSRPSVTSDLIPVSSRLEEIASFEVTAMSILQSAIKPGNKTLRAKMIVSGRHAAYLAPAPASPCLFWGGLPAPRRPLQLTPKARGRGFRHRRQRHK